MENMNEKKRQERRRKIMERESDRMALITGRNLQNHTPSTSHDLHHNQQYHHHNISENVHQISNEVSKEYSDCHIVKRVEPEQDEQKPETAQKAMRSSKSHPIRQRKPGFFSSKCINSSIIASEGTRIFCALIIAFLVVFSYVDYPLFGRNIVNSRSVVGSRPLYILLLTDVTIMIARLYLEKQRALEEDNEEERAETDRGSARFQEEQNWSQAVKFMERGLVVYQAFCGVFIDCSVYAVVVICGLSWL